MKKRTLLVLLAALPAAVWAQTGGRRRSGGKGGEKGGQINVLEASLTEFEEDLKLAPAQQPAWQAYADAIRALQQDIARGRAPKREDSGVELAKRLDRVVDTARDRLTAIEDIVQAAKGLLKTLTPEQQATADPRLVSLIAGRL